MRNKFLGSGLLMVLILTSVLLVLCVAFGIAFFSTLNFANLYADQTHSDVLARSAVQEFLLLQAQNAPPTPVGGAIPSPLAAFATNQTLLSPDSHLDATATLFLANNTPYHSVDNMQGSAPVQSCFDSGGATSVPPFSLSLVFKVVSGGKTFIYEAMLQQRWPYALAAPGPIALVGACNGAPIGASWNYPATNVTGRVLVLAKNALDEAHGIPPVSDLISIDPANFPLVGSFAAYGLAGANVTAAGVSSVRSSLQVGGNYTAWNFLVSSGDWTWGAMPTTGAQLNGDVDLMNNDPNHQVNATSSIGTPSSAVNGTLNSGFFPQGVDPSLPSSRHALASLFSFPSGFMGWTPITGWPYAVNAGPYAGNIVFYPGPTQTSGQTYYVNVPGGQGRFDHTIATDGQTGTLSIQDCVVGVNGNLTLIDAAALAGNSNSLNVLKGSNATLVVNGTLLVDGGIMQASGNGLVIYCRQALIAASGSYNGLIIAENGLSIYGSSSNINSYMNISGGIIVGCNAMDVTTQQPVQGQPAPITATADARGVSILATNISYDPQYMHFANQFGVFQTLSIRRKL